ncbi:elongation factor Ts [Candidatus Acetothermia bacterium]|nr:elongation factor Ts [Candidatus Acetothermia bacterium]MBI3643736.1 elongation factor Ts [Candidatus Acetothermia bacterium]
MMDCKRALEKAGGDIEKARKVLREEGKAAMATLSSRAASEGRVESYIHHNGKLGVLIQIDCETDFTANSDTFRDFARNLTKHIAAAAPPPRFINPEEVPADVIANEKEIYLAQAQKEGKPANIAEKIVEGRISKLYEEICLLKQPYIMDTTGKTKVEDVLADLVAKIGENIVIRNFSRFQVGR